MFKMINKNSILYIGILIFGIAAPFLFPAFKVQLSILCVLIVLATTWNIQGGEMGYIHLEIYYFMALECIYVLQFKLECFFR